MLIEKNFSVTLEYDDEGVASVFITEHGTSDTVGRTAYGNPDTDFDRMKRRIGEEAHAFFTEWLDLMKDEAKEE